MSAFHRTVGWLQGFANCVAAILLAIMFASFLLNVFMRYVLNAPAGWTSELSTVTWLLAILWGAAFVVREREEIRFDIVYGMTAGYLRRFFQIFSAIALIALYAVALPATLDYVLFMKVEETSYLDIRFDYLYSIYLLFVGAIVLRYIWILLRALQGKDTTRLRDGIGSGPDPL